MSKPRTLPGPSIENLAMLARAVEATMRIADHAGSYPIASDLAALMPKVRSDYNRAVAVESEAALRRMGFPELAERGA